MKLNSINLKKIFMVDESFVICILSVILAVIVVNSIFLPEWNMNKEWRSNNIKYTSTESSKIESSDNLLVDGEKEDGSVDLDNSRNGSVSKDEENSFYNLISQYPFVTSVEKSSDNDFRVKLRTSNNVMLDFFGYVDDRVKNMEIKKVLYRKSDKFFEYELFLRLF